MDGARDTGICQNGREQNQPCQNPAFHYLCAGFGTCPAPGLADPGRPAIPYCAARSGWPGWISGSWRRPWSRAPDHLDQQALRHQGNGNPADSGSGRPPQGPACHPLESLPDCGPQRTGDIAASFRATHGVAVFFLRGKEKDGSPGAFQHSIRASWAPVPEAGKNDGLRWG